MVIIKHENDMSCHELITPIQILCFLEHEKIYQNRPPGSKYVCTKMKKKKTKKKHFLMYCVVFSITDN